MDDSVIINRIDKVEYLHSLVRQDLRDLGIKLPKTKKVKKLNQSRSISQQDDVFSNKIFGEHLNQVPSTFLPDYGHVPQFLVDAAGILNDHLESEGVFRKSGSVGRQKELRLTLEDGNPLDSKVNIYDVAALIKQFFRELPEPLIVPLYHDSFIKCYQLPTNKDPKKNLLQLCLLLPVENIGTLRFTMHMLHKVASKCEKNKMTANNLALVMAPNLMHNNKGTQKMSSGEEKLLHIQTCIIELFIKHWDQVGMVNKSLKQQTYAVDSYCRSPEVRLNLMSECFGTDDDLDASDDNTLENSKEVSKRKKRKRSSSLTGLVSSIAQGFAKLRRSTDGKSINMSSNSTFRGEFSIASNTSTNQSQSQEVSLSSATPCVMRKRRASGDVVPFSATKKKAILGNLPQKSALASTPFTPASTVKRERHQHDDNCYCDTSETPRLNATTPALGSKTPRKKLNLFSSPGSNKKVKRQNSMARMESPAHRKSSKGKNIFRRLSGNRGEKSCEEHIGERLAVSVNVSPKSTLSDSVLHDQKTNLVRSLSSPSLQDPEYSVVVVDDQMSLNKGFIDESAILEGVDRSDNNCVMYQGRSKSVDSPGLRRGQPNTVNNGLLKKDSDSAKQRSKLVKLDISDPAPIVIPVVANAVDIKPDGELRRSRRDEFERGKRRRDSQKKVLDTTEKGKCESVQQRAKPDGSVKSGNNLDKNIASQLDYSLMEAILPPPHGFGDQTMVDEQAVSNENTAMNGCNDDEEEDIDVGSDLESEAGFSTISGGTVMRRTESGRYSRQGPHTTSGSSIVSSVSFDVMKPPRSVSSSLQASVSVDSLLSVESRSSQKSFDSVSTLGRSVSSDSGKGSLFGDVDGQSTQEDTYVTLRSNNRELNPAPEDEYVVLRPKKGTKHDNIRVQATVLEKTRGMAMLCENYGSVSEEESSSNHSSRSSRGSTANNHNTTFGSHQEDLDKMPTHGDVHKKKSISAEDLQTGPKNNVSVRSHSMYISPCKRFNYKPHLEVTRETHNMLARAGYFKPTETNSSSKDVTVPVKSPKRSTYREEMMVSLRSSFHERHSRTMSSFRSLKNDSITTANSSVAHNKSSLSNTSLSSEYEKLSLTSEDSVQVTTDQNNGSEKPMVSELMRKVSEISANIEKGDTQNAPVAEEQDSIVIDAEGDVPEEIISVDTSVNLPDQCELDKDAGESKDLNPPVPKKTKTLNDNKFLTLSGMLDNEIAHQVRIKRAETNLPKQDSVLNNIQQAGMVAQSVRQFSQRQTIGKAKNFAMPPVHKRGNSPVRIPTIFAKNEEKARHYRYIAQFMRERNGDKDFMRLPPVPDTPKKESADSNSDEDASDMSEEESVSVENLTVVEADSASKSSSCFPGRQKSNSHIPDSTPQGKVSLSSPVNPASIELSESLMETINVVCTPRSDKFLSSSHLDKELIKSPLTESTNTVQAPSVSSLDVADSLKSSHTGGQTPHRVLFGNEFKSRSQVSTPGKSHRAHVKRLRNRNSPRRHNNPRSPRYRMHSPRNATANSPSRKSSEALRLSSVPIHIDDES